MPFTPQQTSRLLLPSEIQTLRVQRVMPVLILAVIMSMMAAIALFFILIAWDRVPAVRWLAGALPLLFAGLIIAAILHMRAARADIAAGVARIETGAARSQRTGGRRVTWYYTTFDRIGEVEVSREQYEAVAIGSGYTVSYSPRVSRAWTVDPTTDLPARSQTERSRTSRR